MHKTKKEDKLIVGMELSFPPFEMRDTNGNPKGISVDLAHSLGEYLGKEVEIKHIAWNGLITSLQTKKIDLITSSMAIIEARKEKVDFSDPYAHTVIAALVYRDSPVKKSSDLNHPERTLALRQGTTSYFFALDQFPESKKNSFATETPAITEVIQGKANAFLYDWLSVYKLY
ncbi:extracellular solute-binding protein, family 3 [Brevinema andersonii]|uniref:Extracellular solute-binding protein, family 3 n=1 Tax=Brevinema andersonii TaxID=34097 RepID=A0A1I1EYS2_BREAD|nr:transporter substrate-binding domain-containing protein [Brevinema andersonii]SFB92349.1 extracellular solute-binding protein, family 3 [Brevinema andersonii]